MCDDFLRTLKNSWKLGQKNDFSEFFQRFIEHSFLRPMGDAQIFSRIKGHIMIEFVILKL